MKKKSIFLISFFALVSSYFLYKTYKKKHPHLVENIQESGHKVSLQEIYDLKPLAARVDSQHRVFARSRINGTILSINVEEGDQVKQGAVLLILVDSKIAPQIEGIDAQITSSKDQLELAKMDFERARTLQKSKVIAQSDFDKKQTALKVAEHTLKNLESQKETLLTQQKEGQVLAPISGKVLNIPVTVGSVMMGGENAVELAGGSFILKLLVPESHAGYLKINDSINVVDNSQKSRNGTIVKIYPKLQNGQILADIKLSDIDNLYVDQLLTAHIKTNLRKAIVISDKFLIEKFGLHFVKLKDAGEITVEISKRDDGKVEIVSGLKEGDEILCP